MQTDTGINSKSLEGGQALPAASVPNPDKSISEETKPAGDSKPVDPSTPPEQALAGAVTGTQQSSTEATAQAGDKQEYNLSSAPTNQDKAVPEESTEPARKKQKISDENGVVGNGQPASAVTGNTSNAARNGEKKAGRSKKVKDTVKRIIHSDGIGSRTRSRTKAATT